MLVFSFRREPKELPGGPTCPVCLGIDLVSHTIWIRNRVRGVGGQFLLFF